MSSSDDECLPWECSWCHDDRGMCDRFVELDEDQVRPVAQTSIIVVPATLLRRLSSSEYDIFYVHNSKIKLVQLNICTTKTKLDHYYSSRFDYQSVESFLENSQLTWCIYSTVGDGCSSLRPRVHYTKMSSTREWRRSDPHDNSRHFSSLIYGGHTPSLIFRPSVMVVTPPSPSA